MSQPVWIYGVEGCDEATARLVVAQERVHGRYVEAFQDGERWIVDVYLPPPGWELSTACPEWLRKARKRESEEAPAIPLSSEGHRHED
jgi:hypothetical protein